MNSENPNYNLEANENGINVGEIEVVELFGSISKHYC